MRKTILMGMMALGAFSLFAQKANVNKALTYVNSESELKSADITEAKSLINAALEDPEAATEAKTWYVAGMVYFKEYEAEVTKALKGDTKAQGDWGEIQLELILEKAGLQKGVHFTMQENYKTEDNANVRPDCVINLPEGKNFIIDSKVSLTAYEHYYNEEDDAKRNRHLAEHISSLNRHIQDLGSKSYQNLYGVNPPDYVLLFVPLEAALTLALKEDVGLMDKALSRNIVLVSTSTLLATLRTVSFIWKQENQRKNVIEIAKEGGALYDKFVGFMDDLTKVGLRLDDAKKEYVEAMKKLFESPRKRDTIIGRTQHLKELGAMASKSIPQQLLDRIEE